MADFNVRSDSVNVEQIMDQIRSRIREKRGVDYTEEQIRELAAVRLEKVLDPGGVRSDLLQQFLKRSASPEPDLPNYSFEDSTLYETHRGFIRFMRTLLKPILKLFFNPNPLIQALNIQARRNTMQAEHDSKARATETLLYEVCHNLVVELTRAGIEVKNLKMRVESLASRVEFNERRARALESVVVYKPSDDRGAGAPGLSDANARPAHQPQPPQRPQQQAPAPQPQQSGAPSQSTVVPLPGTPQQRAPGGEGPGQRSRRRRRRRGRRGGGQPAAAIMGTPSTPTSPGGAAQSPTPESGANLQAAQPAGGEGSPDSKTTAVEPPAPADDDFEG
jgi:hypothetical protein